MKLRKFMFIFLCIITVIFGCNSTQKANNNKQVDTIVKYKLDSTWLKLPNDFPYGQVSGIGIDTVGNIVLFQRTNRNWKPPIPDSLITNNTVFIIDKLSGKLISSWGANKFIMPHGLTVDKQNNIWVTDVGLQQVLKFSHDGKLLLTLGQAKIIGDDSTHFNLPTDVAIAEDGSFYVSDGYENSRVVKFSKEGHYLFEWGKRGKGEGEFDLPHSVALDNAGNVYVADRENNRIQKFDSRGKFLKQWQNNEATLLYAVAVGKSNSVFAIDDLFVDKNQPFGDGVIKFDTAFNIKLRFGRNDSTVSKFDYYHDLVLDKDENIYVVNIGRGSIIRKYVK